MKITEKPRGCYWNLLKRESYLSEEVVQIYYLGAPTAVITVHCIIQLRVWRVLYTTLAGLRYHPGGTQIDDVPEASVISKGLTLKINILETD